MNFGRLLQFSACCLLVACNNNPAKPSDQHLKKEASAATHDSAAIPQANPRSVPLPPPKPSAKIETYSVVVTNVPAQEVLFALARDAKINLDIHPGIQGTVTLNAINQTLPQILTRIAKQIDMRYELENGNLLIMPDSPYLKTYKIDYVNMNRDSDGGISNSTQVGSGGAAGGATGGAANNSQLAIKNSLKNHFWERLEKNITDILRETDKILPEGSSETTVLQSNTTSTTGTGAQPANSKKQATSSKGGIENSPNAATVEGEGVTVTRRSTFREAASVIANPESGIATVRATSRQHERIQEFISQVMNSARRQVLIEATIAEVRLSKNYQQGIDWKNIRIPGATGFQLTQLGSAGLASTNTGSFFKLNYDNPNSRFGQLSSTVSLLESFGDVKVLSSPKLSVMNNQTAMLRVVDNLVYFTIQANTTTNQTTTTTTYTTTPITVPTGFTMSVTPQISENETVLLNLRPSITRLLGYVNDPNPSLAAVGVTSRIPQLQTREMESMLQIDNGQIAVLGGLMQDDINNQTDGIPVLASIPLIGGIFQNRNDTTTKTELVVFIRPTVVKNASLDGDLSNFRNNLPDDSFLTPEAKKDNSAFKP